MKVLAFVDTYLPGYKGGGPAVSVSRLIARLNTEMSFYVFTRDRDLGDVRPYSGIAAGDWTWTDGVAVYYATPRELATGPILKVIRMAQADVIYLNSVFSKLSRCVLWLRRVGLCRTPVVIAPRGEFSPGALGLKRHKKALYLRVARAAGLYRGLLWQASSPIEEADIHRAVSRRAECFIKPPDIEIGYGAAEVQAPKTKRRGQARFVFVSRISPKKNLLFAIRTAARLAGEVSLSIYGPVEDLDYWRACEAEIAQLPPRIQCVWEGPVPSSQVRATFARHDCFLFPTLGENFGHVIAEALAAGLPVLLSDQTPWQDLERRGAGKVLRLEDPDAWVRAAQEVVDASAEELAVVAGRARDYLAETAAADDGAGRSRAMFECAVGRAA